MHKRPPSRSWLKPICLLALSASALLLSAQSLYAVYQPPAEQTSPGSSQGVGDPQSPLPGTRRAAFKTHYAQGQLIVKYKDSVTECVHCLLKAKKPFKAATTDFSDSLDRLHGKYNVRAARAVFRTETEEETIHGPKTTTALKQYHDNRTLAVKRKFVQRTQRAAQGTAPPSLTHVYLLELPEDADLEAAASEFVKDPHIEYAEPNYLMEVQFVPNDPYYQSCNSWGQGCPPIGYDDLWGLKKIQAAQAWDVTQGRGVVVAVVDTGVDYTHPDLAANVWTNAKEIPGNGIDDDANGFIDDVRGWDFANGDNDPADDNGHGTHVSGTVAAVGNNGIGIVGVAPAAKVMGVKVLNNNGTGTFSTVAAGIEFAADNGADVMNLSVGGPSGVFGRVIPDAVSYAYRLGTVVVVAAGNAHENAQGTEPANLPEAITVAAFDQHDHKTFFSNFGSKIDVAAPGGGTTDSPPSFDPFRNILSLKARMCNPGVCDPNLIVGVGYVRQAGTSMAAPHVSGAVALILAAHRELSIEQVRHVLRIAADDDVDVPGWDPGAGFGRINTYKAVQLSAVPVATLQVAHEQVLSGTSNIQGNFSPGGPGLTIRRWTLSYTPATRSAWVVLGERFSPATNSVAVSWDVHLLPLGTYWLQLAVEQSDGQLAVDVRQVHRKLYEDVTQASVPAAREAVYTIKAADIDGDGDRDLFIGNLLGSVEGFLNVTNHLWINDGTGHFTEGSSTRLPAGHNSVGPISDAAFVDVDEDGALDLFLASPGLSRPECCYLWMNNGHGGFVDGSTTRLPRQPFEGNIGTVATGDVNGDKHVDIIVTSPLMFLMNNGHGVFSEANLSTIAPGLSIGLVARLADIDRDGDLDLITPSLGGLLVALNNGSGYFRLSQTVALNVNEVRLGDVTGDGWLDGIVVSNASPYLHVLVNDQRGGLVDQTAGGIPAAISNPTGSPPSYHPSLADVDLDADLDLLVLNDGTQSAHTHFVLLNDGTGRFSDQTDQYLEIPFWARPSEFADVTGDAYPDLLIGRIFQKVELRRALWADFGIGDVDGDGHVTISDALRIGQFISGSRSLTPEQQFRARVVLHKPNVTMLDGLVIADLTVGKLSKLPMMFGDVQEDGFVTPDDSNAVAEAVVGRRALTRDQRYKADVNRDGTVDVVDALFIQQFVRGVIPRLPWSAPVLAPIGAKTINEGQRLTLTLSASDPDGDGLTYAVASLPTGATFNVSTRTFAWTPTYAQAGNYAVTFTVTDATGLSDTESITITVTDVPLAILSLSDSADPFSPNGDFTKDTTTMSGTFNHTITSGKLQVKNAAGGAVRTFTYSGPRTSVSQLWDGKDSSSLRVPDGTYLYILTGTDAGGSGVSQAGTVTVDTVAPVVSTLSDSPDPFRPSLGQNTTISFTLSEPSYVTLQIYSSMGTLVRTLLSSSLRTTLTNSIVWNGRNGSGVLVPAGTYTYKLWVTDPAGNRATPYPASGTITVQ